MAFPLTHLAVTGVVLGMRSAEEVRQNVNSFATPVPAQLRSGLCDEGLLDERVPIPSYRPTPTIPGAKAGMVLIEDMTNPPDATS
jgi:hypothetical protein